MHVLSATGLSKSYDGRQLFDDVALGIQTGDRIGLVGPNGSGKSTLLKILAGTVEPDAGEVVADLRDPVWRQERAALLDRSQSFAELLARHGLVLRTDLLSLRGRWITPECEPRRYDTFFFAARMPRGQRADDGSTEAEVASWRSPAQILEGQRAGRDVMLPPTQVMVEELAQVEDVTLDSWLGRPVEVRPVLPVPVEDGGAVAIRIPR